MKFIKQCLFFIITFTILLTACSEKNVIKDGEKIISFFSVENDLSNDERLSEYVTDITFEFINPNYIEDKTNGRFELIAELSEAFDILSPFEQYQFLNSIEELFDEYTSNTAFECIDCYFFGVIGTTLNNEYRLYTDSLKKNETMIFPEENEVIVEEEEIEISEEVTEVTTSSLSQEFVEYNERYYTAFRAALTLIETMSESFLDGEITSYLISDHLMYTEEFNELLDVYITNAHPINDKDQELYGITLNMIAAQRPVNEQRLIFLQTADSEALFKMADGLKEMEIYYSEGRNLLNQSN